MIELEGIFIDNEYQGPVNNVWLFKSKNNGILTISAHKSFDIERMKPYKIELLLTSKTRIIKSGKTIYSNCLILQEIGGESNETEQAKG